jgi:predicted glutamine amidotransferase
MCGLVGIISKSKLGFSNGEIKTFKEMLFVDQLRGMDGTGIFYNNKKRKNIIKTLRAPCNATDFLEDKKVIGGLTDAFQNATILIGHNRAATKGSLTHACTHPFRNNDITLVHNGTLNTWKNKLADTEVDSEAICISMHNKGVEETIKNIDGAFALIWHNRKESTLNITRNYARPLFIIETKDMYILASEDKMVEWVADRNNIVILNKKTVPINTLLSWDVINQKWLEEKILEVYKAPNYYHGHNSSTYWNDYYNSLDDKKTTPNYPVATGGYGKILPTHEALVKELKCGDTISFLPFEIKKNGAVFYLEGFISDDTEAEIEVRYYAEMERLQKIANWESAVGTISGTATYAGDGKYIIVKDVFEGVITKNALTLSKESLSNLSCKCKICEGQMTRSLLLLQRCTVNYDVKTSKYIGKCIDCEEYYEKVNLSLEGGC